MVQGNVVFARELANRYGDQGIISTALNPGNINSDLPRHAMAQLPSIVKQILVIHRILEVIFFSADGAARSRCYCMKCRKAPLHSYMLPRPRKQLA
jgi:NAD(P)-dependent dehydrogenase (short-subunit alcohol dehydrogenase family)